MKKLKKRIILVGRAASGKDYFKNFLIEKGYTPSVSYTTRPIREGEIPGKTYHFVSEEDFMFMAYNDQFFEHKMFNKWGYGTSTYDWSEAELFIFTPSGINSLPKSALNDSVIVFFDIPLDVRINRMEERSDADSIERRLKADGEDFQGFNEFDIRVKNPEFDPEELLEIIKNHIKTC